MNTVLRIERIAKKYVLHTHEIEVLSNIELEVPAGRWIALTGNSGCGKTTLLRILGTLDEPDQGSVTYFGKNTQKMGIFAKARLRREHIGFVFQSYHLFSELDALENVMLPGRLSGGDLNNKKERAFRLLSNFEMAGREHHRPAELSGGEQQRVAIARALMNDPDIIFADEPTGNLDDKTSNEIMECLRRLRDDERKSIVMVTHNPKLTLYADQSFELVNGGLVERS